MAKRLGVADLESGSATIGFVELGIPYFEGVTGICMAAWILEPFKVVKISLVPFAAMFGTIRNTCGGRVQRFQKGETVVLNVVIRDPNGELFTPSNGVKAEVRKEAGTVVLSETAMGLVSTGEYSLDVQTAGPGFVTGGYIVIFKAVDGQRVAIDWTRFRVEEVPSVT